MGGNVVAPAATAPVVAFNQAVGSSFTRKKRAQTPIDGAVGVDCGGSDTTSLLHESEEVVIGHEQGEADQEDEGDEMHPPLNVLAHW